MDNGRSGLNSNETQLTPANVNAASFGQTVFLRCGWLCLRAAALHVKPADQRFQPQRGFVATEMASVYAFDAD